MFDMVEKVLLGNFTIEDKERMRKFFLDLQQTFIDWNDKPANTPEFVALKEALEKKISAANQ